jgi:hypothetical protein
MTTTTASLRSAPSKTVPALIALGVNAILLWGALTATSVLPPERTGTTYVQSAETAGPSSHRDLVAQATDAALVQ